MDSSEIRNQLLNQEEAKPELAEMRSETGLFVADSFRQFGECLQAIGVVSGEDRINKSSPFEFGSDEIYSMSLILRIGSEMSSNTIRLFQAKQTYAASALLRQMVEVEYLTWAFEHRHGDAEKWLRSDKNERWEIFSPAKLRKAAGKQFRAKDYGYHCDMGGHPTPSAMTLLKNDPLVIQLLQSDLLGHMSGIWGHFVGWGQQHKELHEVFKQYKGLGEATGKCLSDWKKADPLVGLGPPP
ncbi:MAG: hypothetical protein ABJ327_01920 [Litoreibacter sp.]